jgi:hypothetical protein
MNDIFCANLKDPSLMEEILILRRDIDIMNAKLKFLEHIFKFRNILHNGFILIVRLIFFFLFTRYMMHYYF